MRKIATILSLFSSALIFGQTSVYECTSSPTVPDAGLTIETTPSRACYDFKETTNYSHPSGLTKTFEAHNYLKLGKNFHMGNSSGSQFVLKLSNTKLDVALFEPSNQWGIPKLEKLELGIQIPSALEAQIAAFAADETDPLGLNPFLEWEVKVVATFRHLSSGQVKKINGFYYRDFIRDVYDDAVMTTSNGAAMYNGAGKLTDEGYKEWGGKWNELSTQHPFRIRFAPPETGEWECSIKLTTATDVVEYPAFVFNVVPSANKGYLRVGGNGRYFVKGNETFLPVGPNICWPVTYKGLDPDDYFKVVDKTPGHLRPPENYRRGTAPLKTFMNYEKNLNLLADKGANNFRYIMAPWAGDIEFEKMGNYYDRMNVAWEMDNMIDLARSRNLNIQFNMLIHYSLEYTPYGNRVWDWSDENDHKIKWNSSTKTFYEDASSIDVNDVTPYCYSNIPGVDKPEEFFRNPTAIKYYKQRLRYIIARWGYSTNIGMWELMSEINLMGTSTISGQQFRKAPYEDALDSNNLDGFTQSNCAYSAHQIQYMVYMWQNQMIKYIKETLGDEHLISPSYSGTIGANDPTYTKTDVVSENVYNNRYVIDPEFFHSTSKDGSGSAKYWMLENWNKPVIFSEHGGLKPHNCDEGLEFKRHLWMTWFLGVAMSNDWNAWYQPEQWHNYQLIRDFIGTTDLNGGGWIPGHLTHSSAWDHMESNDKYADMTYLRSGNGEEAIGVINNRTNNFLTRWTGGAEVVTGPKEDTICDNSPSDVWDHTDVAGSYPSKYGSYRTLYNNGDKLKVYMDRGKYVITYYNTETLAPIAVVHQTNELASTAFRLKYPDLTYNYPFVAFKIKKQGASRLKSSIEETPVSAFAVYPNPSKELLYIEVDLDEGESVNVKMRDVTGKEVLSKVSKNSLNTINTDKFPDGIYLISIQINDRYVETKKVVVQH